MIMQLYNQEFSCSLKIYFPTSYPKTKSSNNKILESTTSDNSQTMAEDTNELRM